MNDIMSHDPSTLTWKDHGAVDHNGGLVSTHGGVKMRVGLFKPLLLWIEMVGGSREVGLSGTDGLVPLTAAAVGDFLEFLTF